MTITIHLTNSSVVAPTPAIWAGYGPDGNDRNGHMHRHRDGAYLRHDGVRGVFCAAPTDRQGNCTDPSPFVDWDHALTPAQADHAVRSSWDPDVM